jgi:multiple sugar transport system substrate-binding protein
MKKLLAILMCVAMLTCGLASIAAAEGKTTVNLWYYWENLTHQAELDKIIQGYNGSQDKVEVVASYIPFADFKKQLSIGAAADTLPDIVILDNPDHAAYSAMGIFADITDKVAGWDGYKKYYPGPMNSCMLDGRCYGIPFGSNDLALFYNEDMLAAAKVAVPTTWDEMTAAAKALTTDKVYGFALSCLQNEEGTFGFLPFLWSTGEDSYHLNSEGGIKALTLYQTLSTDGSLPKEAINWTQGDVMNQFSAGNLAMMVNGTWQIPTMRANITGFKWNVTYIPKDKQYASDLGGENFAIIASGHVDEAFDFLMYATDPARLASYIGNFGYIASRSDVASQQYQGDAVMQQFISLMQYAQARGPHPEWPSISDAISTAFNKVITGMAAPADAAAEAQATIDGIVK